MTPWTSARERLSARAIAGTASGGMNPTRSLTACSTGINAPGLPDRPATISSIIRASQPAPPFPEFLASIAATSNRYTTIDADRHEPLPELALLMIRGARSDRGARGLFLI